MFTGLASTGTYFNQVFSLSTTPVSSFTGTHWSSLVSLIMSLLNNPWFLGFMGIILIMTILPTVDDE